MKLNVKYQIGNWEELSDASSAVRTTVFIEEQSVPVELEWDEHDHEATHIIATLDDLPIGTVRLCKNGTLGRMAVMKDFRGLGIGKALLSVSIDIAKELGMPIITLGAQTHALSFYSQFGFVAEGAEFDDAGIPHKKMTLVLNYA